jgi:hypothetical protein
MSISEIKDEGESKSVLFLGDALNGVIQKLETKNDLLTKEATLVDSSMTSEIEAFQGLEFSINAIVKQLEELIDTLPRLTFGEFVDEETIKHIKDISRTLKGFGQTLKDIDGNNIFSNFNNFISSDLSNFKANMQSISDQFLALRNVMNGFGDNGASVFKALSDLSTAGDGVINNLEKMFKVSGIKMPNIN